MAKKKEEAKIVLERVYNIPLRKAWLKTPWYKRTRRAVRALREFLQKNMKSDNVKIGKYLNLHLSKHGLKNPPHMVKVNVTKDGQGVVKAEIVGAPKEEKKKEKKIRAEQKKEKKKEVAKEIAKDGEEKIEEELQKLKEKTKKIEENKEPKKIEIKEEEKITAKKEDITK